MAYVSQELKKQLAPNIKKICNDYNVKGTLSVRNHSTLVLTIKSGNIDFIGNYNGTVARRDPTGKRIGFATEHISVNTYWYHDHFSDQAKEFLGKVIAAMNCGNHDRSDIQTDYFDVGWYIDVEIGRWNKPYILTGPGYSKKVAEEEAAA